MQLFLQLIQAITTSTNFATMTNHSINVSGLLSRGMVAGRGGRSTAAVGRSAVAAVDVVTANRAFDGEETVAAAEAGNFSACN